MSQSPSRGIVMAVGIAVMMHLLLFVAVRPSAAIAPAPPPIPPATCYLFQPLEKQLPAAGSTVRTVKSPVIFSLPSGMGFSRELQNQEVRTRLSSFSKKKPSERFLDVDPSARNGDAHLDPQRLMLSAGKRAAPSLPNEVFHLLEKCPAARRVTMAPELKKHLVGGIVLPPELNVAVSRPWEVHASVSVSEQGMVRHVFFDRPLDSDLLNQQVLHLLYTLRFEPGTALEGDVEIYSTEAAEGAGVKK